MKTFKRVLSMLLIVVMVVTIAPTAFADETTEVREEDTYVLHRYVKGDGYEGKKYQYISYCMFNYIYENVLNTIQSIYVYSMYDSYNGKVIPAYCTDIDTSAKEGTVYRRLNLEDSGFSGSAAGKIRAIMQNGFYLEPISSETAEEHEVRAKEEAKLLGIAAGILDNPLTVNEALAATQCAIWQATHGSRISFPLFASSFQYKNTVNGHAQHATMLTNEYSNDFPFTISNTSDKKVLVDERIRIVYNYLLSLEPVGPTTRTVSSSSFTDLNDPVFLLDENGKYTVTVTATIDVNMVDGDSLTLKATLGDKFVTTALTNGQQTVTMTLSDVPKEMYDEDVFLSISGTQTASGVFFFDASGERDASQSMLGMSSSRMPVFAKVVAEESRVLDFEKTTSDGFALEGIIFDIYQVSTLEDYLSGKSNLPDPKEYSYPKKAEYTVITDQNGQASLNLTQHGLPDGVYLVVEKEHPAIVAPIAPFYVILPATNAEGTGYDYVVTVKPKNEVKGGVKIEKDVISLNNNEASVDAYTNHTWIISSSIPEDISGGKSYVITDTLDNRLDYLGNVKVTVESVDGEIVAAILDKDVDYKITVKDVDSLIDGKPSDSFVLELTQSGMDVTANAVGNNNYNDYTVRVRYDAQINANAEMGVNIPNKAQLNYVNSVNFVYEAISDNPVVYTGAANLLKVDANDSALTLSGATFEVYRQATEKEVADPNIDKITLGNYSAPLIKVSFFNNAALSGNKVNTVTSNEDGKIAIYGLEYGTYYLKEIKAPAGYNLLGDVMTLTINGESHTNEEVTMIENVSGTVLPETGGTGITVYTFTGLALVAVSIILLIKKQRTYGSDN